MLRVWVGGRLWGEGLEDAPGRAAELGMETWTKRMDRWIQQAFRSGGHGARGGQQWEPWAASTFKRKLRQAAKQRGVGSKKKTAISIGTLLVDSSDMRGLITSTTRRFGFASASGVATVFGSVVPYFKYHQSDEPRKSNLPRRAIIEVTMSDRKRLIDDVERTLLQQLGRRRKAAG